MIDAVRGLAGNPAAPAEVLLRLLEAAPKAAADGLARRAALSCRCRCRKRRSAPVSPSVQDSPSSSNAGRMARIVHVVES